MLYLQETKLPILKAYIRGIGCKKARFKAKNFNRFINKARGSRNFEKRFTSAYL